MARQSQANEFNTFIGGLVTEASPLTYPPNTALDINNFKVSKIGLVSRRLGIDFEANYSVVDSGVSTDSSGEIAINTFNWKNAGSIPRNDIVVIQTGNVVKFFSVSGNSVSSGLLHTETINTGVDIDFSGAVVDGMFVLTTGSAEVYQFTYEAGGIISTNTFRIKIRDLFGVEDVALVKNKSGSLVEKDLRLTDNINLRPEKEGIPDTHIYNLRNATYAIPRIPESADEFGLSDPIRIFNQFIDPELTGELWTSAPYLPSNADSVNLALYPDAEDSDDRFTDRFFPSTLVSSAVGNLESPKGYFVIDLLDRGASRLAQVDKLVNEASPEVDFSLYLINDLPSDTTPGGATTVGEFAGRIWYGGFSGKVIDGDKHSPVLSSYVFYSRLVESSTDLGACYQVGDPTSKEAPDLVDTDGGFIRVDGAYNILSMTNIGQALVIIAENGVWAVLGGSDYGFTATENKIVKITEHGCISANSVILVDGSVIYWGADAIYQVSGNELGGLSSTNITNASIQTLYDEISPMDKAKVQGRYDSFERTARWIYGNRLNDTADSIELVLDLNISAYYKHTIPGVASDRPNLITSVEVPPFKFGEVTNDVYFGEELVLYGTDTVQDTQSITLSGLRELLYVVVTDTFPTVKYTLANYQDSNFIDWKSQDGVGVDSPAYILTGYQGLGDYQRYKQVPYTTFHFNKTEDGFYIDEEGDIYPTKQSSCIVQAQWEWANSITSGRWGREFQAYRHRRGYIPENASDSFDNGFTTVTSKNKIRGKGKVLSFLIKTEPLKDCQLLGWSMITSIATNV